MIETSIDRIQGEKYCSIFTAEKKFINQLKEFAKEYPESVQIQYTNKDGSILAVVPFDWFRFVKPPSKRNFTDEQRQAMSERMKKAREKKNGCS